MERNLESGLEERGVASRLVIALMALGVPELLRFRFGLGEGLVEGKEEGEEETAPDEDDKEVEDSRPTSSINESRYSN